MSDLCSGQLKLYSNIPETEVDWLWYPYIPFGKLSVLNGDPGNGKSYGRYISVRIKAKKPSSRQSQKQIYTEAVIHSARVPTAVFPRTTMSSCPLSSYSRTITSTSCRIIQIGN